MKVKHDSGTGTDVAVISAEDLKWVAETWPEHSETGGFSAEVLNMMGVLDRTTIEE